MDNNPIGVGESLVPKSSNFLKSLGITHQDIITHCNGTLKLGIVFDGFNRPGECFSFPFGIGESKQYNASSIDRIIDTSRIPQNMFDYPDIATHFRTTEMADYLDTRVGEFTNLKIVREVATKEGLEGTYDLLIDSTGFGRHVSFMPDNFEDVKHIIPNNQAFTTRVKYTDLSTQFKPYSLFKAMEYGWCWHIPLQDTLVFGYVHDNKFDVTNEFVQHVNGYMGVEIAPANINTIKFTTGRNKIHLKNNVAAIGLASAFIEPLESTGIYLIIASIEKLAQYIEGAMTEDEYNYQANEAFDSIVNFIAAHYKYSARSNEYWNHYKTLDIQQYKETDIFPKEAWNYLLSGFDLGIPKPTDATDPRELINIYKGTPYYNWIQDASNFT